MTLENSATQIYCQTCGNAWDLDDADGRHYFRSTTTYAIGDMASPADIVAAGERMTFCPRCDTEQLEPTPIPDAPSGVKGRDPFYDGDDRMIGSDPDATGGSENVPDVTPGNADSAVTHRVD